MCLKAAEALTKAPRTPSQVALLSRIFLAERFTVARTVAVLLAFAGPAMALEALGLWVKGT